MEKADKKEEDINLMKLCVPSEFFKDFREIDEQSEGDFEYIVSQILLEFTEKFTDKAIEFPNTLPS